MCCTFPFGSASSFVEQSEGLGLDSARDVVSEPRARLRVRPRDAPGPRTMSSPMVAAFNAPCAAPSVTSRRRAAASRSRGTFSVSAARRAPAVAFVDVVDEKEPGILLKPFEESMQKSLLFGVSHMTNNHEAAEYILRTRPRSVVVETGLCKAHNAARGTCFNFDELFASIHIGGNTDAEEALQFITRVAHQLRLEEKPLEESPFWAHMKTQLPAEALVYAAAFAVDARLVFGDRPKEATYRRLVSCPTLAELDATFGNQSERNYRLLLPEDHPQATIPPAKADDVFENVCINERDVILAHTIYEEATMEGVPGEVVAVVGSDHLAGVERNWTEMVETGGKSRTSQERLDELLAAPDTTRDAIGTRLAIMQRLLGLRCTESLVQDAFKALDDDMNTLEGEEIIAFNATSEIYGSARMLLACVEDREVFDAVVGGVEKSDFADALAPMREVRPANGGVGWSEDAIVWLRTVSAVDVSALAPANTSA